MSFDDMQEIQTRPTRHIKLNTIYVLALDHILE